MNPSLLRDAAVPEAGEAVIDQALTNAREPSQISSTELAFTTIAFNRKEHQLRTLFAELTMIEARTMSLRLANPKADDPLAQTFSRLTQERRTGLVPLLADARRRAARLQG